MKTAANVVAGRPVTIWMRHADLERLDRVARAVGLSRSDVMRTAIRDAVELLERKTSVRRSP